MRAPYSGRGKPSREELGMIIARIRGREYRFLTAPGVFSWRRIDPGTQLLAENMDLEGVHSVLDLGCGYGVLGIVAAKELGEGHVVMTDVNRRAIWLANENRRLNDVEDITEVREGSLYDPVEDEEFDRIVSNPPIREGLDLVLRIVREAPNHLTEDGELWLVVRRKMGSKRILSEMRTVFGSAEVAARGGGYWVLRAPG
ncbi:class I SAM-dependent methyltransferase [Methanopyrus kandleri]|uniref:16S rRNA G1207 methylase n=2 Tax=Methanopyrus kandleri TaxID=2320 RepID=Q8TXG5_METKA|nr:class I SAM-dependent methyltransferase [Methanopyrus kandleri]AAM01923.1 16S rRNA G1207 methylase [Methanopyrus kandleri AV19]HII70064.1 class I SAM-dependent methyltransferase [Methanopyrus kandleri]